MEGVFHPPGLAPFFADPVPSFELGGTGRKTGRKADHGLPFSPFFFAQASGKDDRAGFRGFRSTG